MDRHGFRKAFTPPRDARAYTDPSRESSVAIRAEDRSAPLPVGIVRRRLWVSERRRRLHRPPRSEVAHVGLLIRRLAPDVAVEAERPVVGRAIPLRPLLPLLHGNDCAGRTAHGWNACSVSAGRNGRQSGEHRGRGYETMHGFLHFGANGCSASVMAPAAQSMLARGCDSGRFRVRIFRVFASNWPGPINRTRSAERRKASAVRSRQADGRSEFDVGELRAIGA